MRKKRVRILFFGLLAFLLCACGLLALLLHARGSGLPKDGHWSEGRYLRLGNTDLIIFEGPYGEACSMGKADETVSFDGLENGDLIRIYTNWIGLTYPGQTVVYAVEKLEDGNAWDLPAEELDKLRELGNDPGPSMGGEWITGRYLRGQDSDLIVNGEWDVISMGVAEDTVSFEGLKDGDLIRVYIKEILETWPGQTSVYAVEKLEDGDLQDISAELLEELAEMGWLETGSNDVPDKVNFSLLCKNGTVPPCYRSGLYTSFLQSGYIRLFQPLSMRGCFHPSQWR